jgi:LemA protein
MLGLSIIAVVLLVALVIVAVIGVIYNRLVALRQRFKNAFAQIDVQLKRRYDLIPNLVETARGFMTHERETLEAVIAARNTASSARASAAQAPESPAAIQGLMQAELGLGGALGRLFAVVEAYPDLKANQQMNTLMEELTSTENKISFARQAFNDAVMSYNTMREQFPAVIIANTIGFQQAEFFEIEDSREKEAVQVSFR